MPAGKPELQKEEMSAVSAPLRGHTDTDRETKTWSHGETDLTGAAGRREAWGQAEALEDRGEVRKRGPQLQMITSHREGERRNGVVGGWG